MMPSLTVSMVLRWCIRARVPARIVWILLVLSYLHVRRHGRSTISFITRRLVSVSALIVSVPHTWLHECALYLWRRCSIIAPIAVATAMLWVVVSRRRRIILPTSWRRRILVVVMLAHVARDQCCATMCCNEFRGIGN